MEDLYRIDGLRYNYLWNHQKVPVLKGIDLTIPKSCFTCIVGPSGSGKTTLLNLLGFIDVPSEGKLIFEGKEISGTTESEKEDFRLHKIGFVFQAFYLIPTLTVLENTSYFLPSLGFDKIKMKTHAMEILALLGLADHAKKKPSELSGGQRQRVAIARAIAKRPAVVLADEPTANLDSGTASKIIDAFKELRRVEKTSFIFSTHDSHLVSHAETIYQMKDGLLQAGEHS